MKEASSSSLLEENCSLLLSQEKRVRYDFAAADDLLVKKQEKDKDLGNDVFIPRVSYQVQPH